jgi:hypothetical protein
MDEPYTKPLDPDASLLLREWLEKADADLTSFIQIFYEQHFVALGVV